MNLIITPIEAGLMYAIVAFGVYLTFRILDFPDLTVDQSFTTGAATAAVFIINGTNPLLAMVFAFIAGALAGTITGLLHTVGGINPLLAGILTMLGLYSINLRIMGDSAPNVSLLTSRDSTTVFQWIRSLRGWVGDTFGSGLAPWTSVILLVVFVILLKLALDWFLATDLGLALQATGDNEQMVRSFGVSTGTMKVLGLALSNGLVALAGSIFAQFQGQADINMGVGLILTGLASVILGQAILGSRSVFMSTLAVLVGAVLYRGAIQGAIQMGAEPNDMRLISAIIVVIALLVPKWRAMAQRKDKGLPPSDGCVTTENPDGDTDAAHDTEAGSLEQPQEVKNA